MDEERIDQMLDALAEGQAAKRFCSLERGQEASWAYKLQGGSVYPSIPDSPRGTWKTCDLV